MTKRNSPWMMSLLCCLSLLCFSRQSNANELSDALDVMYAGKINPASARTVTNLTITHIGATFNLKNGTIVFFEPVTLNGKQQYWGGYFVGEGNFSFAPPIKMERDQLQRFFKKDSLSGMFTETALLFSDSIYNLITANSTSADPATQIAADRGNDYREDFTKNENREFIFAALKSLVEPAKEPFLLAALRPQEIGYIWYYFNPFAREEVRFYKEYKHLSGNVMEMVCSYSQFVDSTHTMINGVAKYDINESHFNVSSTIKRDGMFTAKTAVSSVCLRDSLRMIEQDLHYELVVDSIVTRDGSKVDFRRYKDKDHRQYPLYILLNETKMNGDSLQLTYYYSGKISEAVIDAFYMTASLYWIPWHNLSDGATFTTSFAIPKGTEFVATGKETERKEVGNELHTTWEVTPPAINVSFSLGFMKKYQYKDDIAGTVDMYYDPDVSMSIARWYALAGEGVGSHMEQVVADDIINSTRLFIHRFGKRPSNHLVASESFATHGEAFVDFLHLGASTWINTSDQAYDKLLRSHEVAHQWWGIGVDNETYHDKWLSEGFAEYSSLIYLQTVMGNKEFLKRLEKYRKNIYGSRKFLLGDAQQAGPIALGYRTANSQSEGGAYGLIIYEKGAYVLHMLRNLFLDLNTMNEDAFFDMMKEWYTTYQGKSATTADFKRLTEKYVGVDMSWFFDQWVYGTELPTYTFSYEVLPDTNNTYKVQCTVVSEGVSPTFITDVPVQIQMEKDRSAYIRVAVSGPKTEFSIPGLSQKPQKIIFNAFESILAEVKQ